MGTEALYKWWELVRRLHPDVPERDKLAHTYKEATRNTSLQFIQAAIIYSFLHDFPEEEEDPVEEVANPFFQLDEDASQLSTSQGHQVTPWMLTRSKPKKLTT